MRELPPLLDFFEKGGKTAEVIVVNDGSEASQLKSLQLFCSQHQLRLLSHDVNLGKGAAVRTGMLNAKCDIRIFTDADIPFQYSIFDDVLNTFQEKEVMVVAGDRRESDYFSKTPIVRRLGSMIFSAAVNVIMCRNLGDTQCGFKAFRAVTIPEIFAGARLNGFAADIEWIYAARRKKLALRWVRAEFRNAGESSVVFWKQAVRMLLDVIRLRLS